MPQDPATDPSPEPAVPAGTTPEDVDAPVVRDEDTGEQRYPEQFTDHGPAGEKGE